MIVATMRGKHNNDNSDDDESLLDAKNMDGPVVKWAPNDLFQFNNRAFLSYHVMTSGYDYLTPVGATLGGIVGLSPSLRHKLFPRLTSPLQVAGTCGFAAGVGGMALGLGLMYSISQSKNPKLPFDDDGIQMRVDGLKHNFMVRVMDLGVMSSAVAAGGVTLVLGPTSLGLSVGSLGVMQGIGLGSAVGSLASIGCISKNKSQME